jgi:hypothetical protein
MRDFRDDLQERVGETRPSNVVQFEQLMYLTLGISVIQTMLLWDPLVSVVRNGCFRLLPFG